MILSTIEAMDASDRELWKERIQERDEQLGSWFCLCTEDLHNCFHVELDQTHIAESVSVISRDPEDTQEATKT